MQIAFEHELSDADAEKLAGIIACDVDQLEQRFSSYAKAAADEYVQMFLGRNAFRRANDFLDYRIYLLIVHVLDGRLPDEATVSRLFQTSATESRARIRSVTSKYQRGLEEQIRGSVQALLQAAEFNNEGDRWEIEVNNQAVIDLLNSALAERNGRLQQVSKVRGSAASYSMTEASYQELCDHYGVE
jgi:hypothetical protein